VASRDAGVGFESCYPNKCRQSVLEACGSFKLSGLNRQPPSDGSKFGTCKSAACVWGGRRMVFGCSGVGEPSSDWYASDEKHKGKVGSCDFTISYLQSNASLFWKPTGRVARQLGWGG
jgi:hypothetical protein